MRNVFLTFIGELLYLRERNVPEEWEYFVVCLVDLEDNWDEDTYRDDQEQNSYDQNDDVRCVEVPNHTVVVWIKLLAEIKWGDTQIPVPVFVYVVDLTDTCCNRSFDLFVRKRGIFIEK